MAVSNSLCFHPYLKKIPILTDIFQMGWNHQAVTWLMSFFAGWKSIIHTFQGTIVAYPTYEKFSGTQLPLKGPGESVFFVRRVVNQHINKLLMEEILHQLIWYLVVPTIDSVLYIPGGAGFLPSTVSWVFARYNGQPSSKCIFHHATWSKNSWNSSAIFWGKN